MTMPLSEILVWIFILSPSGASAQASTSPIIQDIRLADGRTVNMGRFEVLVNGVWGTVCDDLWDMNDATVTCQQLGYPGAEDATHGSHFRRVSGTIWLDNVDCVGDETTLDECPKNDVGDEDCDDTSQNAGVVCLPWETPPASAANRWRTDYRCGGEFLAPNGGVAECDPNETNPCCSRHNWCGFTPSHCNCAGCIDYRETNGHNTPSTTFQGRSSSTVTQETRSCDSEGKVRLSGGNATAGRVEICLEEEWGSVCDDGWGLEDAEVVCRELRFKKASAAIQEAFFGEGHGRVHLDESRCFGNETRLLSCPHSRTSNCQHEEDASVSCVAFVNGEIRLVGGNASAGRVEVYFDGQWGTVCDDGWDIHDANVVCRSIGFIGAVSAPKNAKFGEGEGLIHIDATMCKGDEQSLVECEYKRDTDCTHHEDASAVCETIEERTNISLVGLIPLLSLGIFTALVICALIATTVHCVSRRQRKRKEELQELRRLPIRTLPEPVASNCGNFVDTSMLESDTRPEKENKTTTPSTKSKGRRLSENNLYMSLMKGDNEYQNYERHLTDNLA